MRQGRTLQGRKAPRVQAGSASQSDRIHRMACCRPDASNPPRNGAVSRCRPGPLPYRGRVTAVCDGRAPAQAMAVFSASRTNGSLCAYAGAGCPRRESDRTVSDLDAAPPTKLGYEDSEPPPGADPGHPPYEGGAAAVRGRRELGNQDSNLN